MNGGGGGVNGGGGRQRSAGRLRERCRGELAAATSWAARQSAAHRKGPSALPDPVLRGTRRAVLSYIMKRRHKIYSERNDNVSAKVKACVHDL